jgi:hypothetical protein
MFQSCTLSWACAKDQPPFAAGDMISGRPGTEAAKHLRRTFGANRIVLGREPVEKDGEWYLFDRPVEEFRIATQYSKTRLEKQVKTVRDLLRRRT